MHQTTANIGPRESLTTKPLAVVRTYLKGCEVYYEYGLTDSGFKIRNPNASRSCGCGTSFEAVGEEGTYDPANECK